ncbi:hypothetical protein [Halalkalibacter akibai]|uniref:Uncharacterized protein n=1 Tax=Halalkalibacter akibai (strain ATCC 43226 / DSM 21942 / CIP 109018 / JCM 9157 / 1139) TaxID=1236973 RepID=W4QWN6_HALA3|nr:hypothetical protein [Halalkalibacter akibai]GAE36496.1 hypothetical protein JCM9157_3687 [Halalkalibacter akibai JCM 9157]
MFDFMFALVGSTMLLIVSIYYLREFLKEGKSFKGKLTLIFIIFFSSILFIYSIVDVTKIMLNQTEVKEGKCEIKKNIGYRGTQYISVYFYEGNSYFTFPIKKYPLIDEGDFYCTLEHYRDTDIEISLKVFNPNSEQELKIK